MQGEGIFREYKPNFFFTSEGEAVIFGGNSMNYANILLTKEIDPYDKLIELIEVDSKDMRLRKRSVQSLGNAYKMMGDLEKAIEVYKLNVKLHPEFIPALQSLIETYDE
jgi:tetratricopeptide (TPR) repeat protein